VIARVVWLVGLGLLALVVFALVTMPAAVLARPLARSGITASSYAGSIWSGTAQGFAWEGIALGDVAWTLTPLRLLSRRAAGHARLTRSDGSIETRFDLAFSGADVRLAGVRFALPLEALESLPLGLPKGWQGRATGAFDEIHVENGWPVTLRGSLDLDGLVAPPPRSAPVGSFRAVFPHPRPQPSLSVTDSPGNLTGQVEEKGGPFDVDAQLTLSRERQFSLEGTVATQGAVPPAMERSLQLLGPADAAGRRQFSVGGTL
jgi:general secretion pathway protein N